MVDPEGGTRVSESHCATDFAAVVLPPDTAALGTANVSRLATAVRVIRRDAVMTAVSTAAGNAHRRRANAGAIPTKAAVGPGQRRFAAS